MKDYAELMKDFIKVEGKMIAVLTVLSALEKYYYIDYQPEQYALVNVLLWLLEDMRSELTDAISTMELQDC